VFGVAMGKQQGLSFAQLTSCKAFLTAGNNNNKNNKTITCKQNKYQELANKAKHSSSDPISNIIYCSNPKVTIAKSKKT
jgi:hypothetical protein